MAIQETLQCLVSNQANQAQVSIPAPPLVEPILDESVQSITLADAENLSVVRWPASLLEEPTLFLRKAEIEAMFKHLR